MKNRSHNTSLDRPSLEQKLTHHMSSDSQGVSTLDATIPTHRFKVDHINSNRYLKSRGLSHLERPKSHITAMLSDEEQPTPARIVMNASNKVTESYAVLLKESQRAAKAYTKVIERTNYSGSVITLPSIR
jgi:hypothetical protein